MICFVAPTIVQGEYYTFWANSCTKNFEESDQESDLRRILEVDNTLIRVQLLNESLVNYKSPKWSVDLSVKTVDCELDGPAMWHLVSIFNIFLFSRGEKSSELLFIEEAKIRDMQSLEHNTLREMID